jgi:hypothetical protein
VNFARVVTFLLLVSVCVAARTTRRLVYLCDSTPYPLPLKNPFAIPDLFEAESLGGRLNLSQIKAPQEFRVHELTTADTKSFSAFLISLQHSCRPIYADVDVDVKGGMQLH